MRERERERGLGEGEHGYEEREERKDWTHGREVSRKGLRGKGSSWWRRWDAETKGRRCSLTSPLINSEHCNTTWQPKLSYSLGGYLLKWAHKWSRTGCKPMDITSQRWERNRVARYREHFALILIMETSTSWYSLVDRSGDDGPAPSSTPSQAPTGPPHELLFNLANQRRTFLVTWQFKRVWKTGPQ